MTMHLEKTLSSINTRKPKIGKLTKAKLKQYEEERLQHNKRMRQNHMHHFQIKTLEEYIDYSHGKMKINTQFKNYSPQRSYRRETPDYPSVDAAASHNSSGLTPRKESQKYTGTYIKGIATMHKSNLIPVSDDNHMKDLARMRR